MYSFVSNLRPAEIVRSSPFTLREDQAMRANVGYQGLDADWTRVSQGSPCPVCGGLGDCRTHVEEQFACCVQEPSEWRLDNGGWLHRIELAPALLATRMIRISAPGIQGELGEAAPDVVS
jgi:hypothetical protein